MTRGAIALAALLAASCRSQSAAPPAGSAGERLEAAAMAAGLIVDPGEHSIVGAWARDTDRACILPGTGAGDARIGLLIDYGAGTGCAASGSVRRRGETLDIRLGECRITARLDGNRLTLPAELPALCDRFCTGHATLAAMTVEQQSGSPSEAASLRTPSGRSLCEG